MPVCGNGSPHNPFSAEHHQPGAIPWIGSPTIQQLGDTWRQAGWMGQILGPHGTGKTTLLRHLANWARLEGHEVMELRGSNLHLIEPVRRGVLVVLDSAEEVGWLRWLSFRLLLRRRQSGLLVTSHRRLGLPTLFQTRMNAALAGAIVARLDASISMPQHELDAMLARHQQNLREVLFELFDRHESRTTAHRGAAAA